MIYNVYTIMYVYMMHVYGHVHVTCIQKVPKRGYNCFLLAFAAGGECHIPGTSCTQFNGLVSYNHLMNTFTSTSAGQMCVMCMCVHVHDHVCVTVNINVHVHGPVC